ncbi:dna helicase mcm8-like [Stylonychia lemnae]|uniref:DNA helicase n=1 Tax=Stylonychia lemnae TaxID=5949 RepID=A0A077ZUI7_STYLE|nr:dna helicase mcm8-like [Stylonychia lemnae]|eukprot:CDW72960.1 dna helicase mcm8-like [Stylonychia lemnae]
MSDPSAKIQSNNQVRVNSSNYNAKTNILQNRTASSIPQSFELGDDVLIEDKFLKPMNNFNGGAGDKLLSKWTIYFPHEKQKSFDSLLEWVYFIRQTEILLQDKKDDNFDSIVVHINFAALYQIGSSNLKQFLDFLNDHPTDMINCMALALDNVRQNKLKNGNDNRQVIVISIPYHILIGPILQFQSHIFLVINQVSLDQQVYLFKRDSAKNCRGKTFLPEKHTAKTSFYQRIRIQEIENDLKDINAGKLPKTIDCEIKDDLIDACISGDIVTICGIMKTELQSDMKGFGAQKANKNKALHASYIDVNSIKNSNTEYFLQTSTQSSYQGGQIQDDKVNMAELSEIHRISERRDVFQLLIKSICPSIFGHELVKTGLLLSLFGGTDYRLKLKGHYLEMLLDKNSNQQEDDEDEQQSTHNIRPDIHLLIVGDPGLGKSQMLKHIINVAPRGVYVCGNSTTNAGLTATIVRDPMTNEQNLEAGALVLSDLGVCCIDEFDKMTSDQNTLLEAMEQQTISIAKGGILGSLSARCSIIACANPVTGHYKFDLVFLLLDDPDVQRDKKLSEHVMKLHSRNRKRKLEFINHINGAQNHPYSVSLNDDSSSITGNQAKRLKQNFYSQNVEVKNNGDTLNGIKEQDFVNYTSMLQKIKHLSDRIPESEIIPPQIMKKYISYAKHTVFPKLSIEACEVIKDFYLTLREEATHNQNTLPITSRQLDSLIRLTQARAKLEFRNIATRDDAMDIVRLVQESLFESCSIDMGKFGGSNSSQYSGLTGQGRKGANQVDLNNIAMLSIPKQTKFYLDRLRQEAETSGNKIFDFQGLIRIGKEMNLQVGDFKLFIEKLNMQNALIMKPGKQWELMM